nr:MULTISPECIES: TetR/AcrR family transcriptional regulator [unclassified Corynebacterium]
MIRLHAHVVGGERKGGAVPGCLPVVHGDTSNSRQVEDRLSLFRALYSIYEGRGVKPHSPTETNHREVPRAVRTDARERRQRIIDAACHLFRTSHPAEVTMERVAERARVGIATVYRNFPDREALMLTCALYLLEVVESMELDALARFAADPARAECTWRRFVFSLVELGAGTLIPALTPDSLEDLSPEGARHRLLVRQHTQAILNAAARHGLVSPALPVHEFVTQLTVLTRPPVPGVHSLNPGVTEQLVEAYLAHQRTLGQRTAEAAWEVATH